MAKTVLSEVFTLFTVFMFGAACMKLSLLPSIPALLQAGFYGLCVVFIVYHEYRGLSHAREDLAWIKKRFQKVS